MAPKATDQAKHHHLKQYNSKFLGITNALSDPAGKNVPIPTLPATVPCTHNAPEEPLWMQKLPSAVELLQTKFGKPDGNHSFTQEACGETILFFLLKSGYVAHDDLIPIHPLVPHLIKMMSRLSTYNFTWIRTIDKDWASQKVIASEKRIAMMACLLHYNMDVGLLMRYLGNNYTGAYRDVNATVKILSYYKINTDLIQHYIRVMTVGCPNHFVAETSRANVMEYWREGNNPSIKKNINKVNVTMNKEERNNFVAPLSCWLFRFIPHLMIIPQHHHEVKGKKGRQISDAKFRHTMDSISVNMMTSCAKDTELHCAFGDVKKRLYTRIYNLRITYPLLDIIIHANDVKSCFRQLKHHPDVVGAFSSILDDILYLQIALSFGSDFSPANWEVIRRLAEILAEQLFDDKSLVAKHRIYLDRLKWQRSLGSKKAKFTQATPDSLNTGVLDAEGNDAKTPHDMFVDDDIYAEIYCRERIEQAIAASIEAIFILLGDAAIHERQHPVSFDKLEDTPIDWVNRLLGVEINTRTLAVRTPIEYVQSTTNELATKWHTKKQQWFVLDMESITGRLGHIADTSPWLRFLMSHFYTSITSALGVANAHLINTRSDFRAMLKLAKRGWIKGGTYHIGRKSTNKPSTETKHRSDTHSKKARHISFAMSKSSKMVHQSRLWFKFNDTLRRELKLILDALSCTWIDMWRPIGHLVDRTPSGIGYSDSCLHAAGGFSFDMKFWWYHEWSSDIQACTLKYVMNGKDGTLVAINALEYASLIINYVAAFHALTINNPSASDPHPIVLLYADNTTAEAWMIKASKKSLAGRALGRIQAALMINNPVGINAAHISTTDNEIADKISRILTEANLLADMQPLFQDFPLLQSCRRFQPSAELISLISETLLLQKYVDPLQLSRHILSAPGRITT